MKKILILLANTDKDTFSGAIADTYERVAASVGHDVVRRNIGDLVFDPILHKGYKEVQPLEPDLVELQNVWKNADHVVIIYPNWWNTMPAILKGLFDRFWLPGFAFNFDKTTHKIVQHMQGKTARVIITAGTHSPFETWWKFGDYTNEIQYGILDFAGMKSKVTAFGPCERVDNKCRTKWLQKVEKLAGKGL